MEEIDIIQNEAQQVIDLVFSQSLKHIEAISENSENLPVDSGLFVEHEDENWSKMRNASTIKWPKIGDFTDESVGLAKISEYIEKDWKGSPGGPDQCWLYCIDFIQKKILEFNDIYVYRARFSIPTRRQPIPRHTVSIYFTMDVSKVRAKTTTVDVSFVVETMRLVHKPSTFRFRQKWLENIILLKEKLSEGIDF